MYGYDIESAFAEHQHLITGTIRRNRPLLAALRLEDEDVAQELAVKMLKAIESFDPGRSASLAAHICCSLQYMILDIKRRHKPHGMTGVPRGIRPDFLYLDKEIPSGGFHEVPSNDDTGAVEFSEFWESLSGQEADVIKLRVAGYTVKRKAHIVALDGARRKYVAMYDERSAA